jgi:hypothetical protein
LHRIDETVTGSAIGPLLLGVVGIIVIEATNA